MMIEDGVCIKHLIRLKLVLVGLSWHVDFRHVGSCSDVQTTDSEIRVKAR